MRFVEMFIDKAKKSGIERMNFYLLQSEVYTARMFDHALNKTQHGREEVLGIEGAVDGRRGAVFTEALEESDIPRLVETLRQTAAAGGLAYQGPVLRAKGEGCPGAPLLDDVVRKHLEQQLVAADEAARWADERVRRIDLTGTRHVSRITLMDETGSAQSDAMAWISFRSYCTAEENGEVQTANVFHMEGGPFDFVHFGRKGARRAASLLGAAPLPGGRMPVLFEADAFAELLAAFVPALHAKQAQNGTSPFAALLGQPVAAPLLTLAEQPDGPLCRTFDDEGTPTAEKDIIREGTLATFLHNRETARKAGVASTGNGYRMQYNAAVSTGATNLVVQNGAYTWSALLGQLGNGLVISECDGAFAGVNPVSGDFSLLAKGFLVQGGRPVRPVNQITVGGSLQGLLQGVVAMGSEPAVNNDHGFVMRCPAVLVRELAVSGN